MVCPCCVSCNLTLCVKDYVQEKEFEIGGVPTGETAELEISTGAFAMVGLFDGPYSVCGGDATIIGVNEGYYFFPHPGVLSPDEDLVTRIFQWTEYHIVETCDECEEIAPTGPVYPVTLVATLISQTCVTITEGFPCECNPLP